MVQWLARLSGTQEIRGSSPGRGMTDFCTSIFICLYIYIYNVSRACAIKIFQITSLPVILPPLYKLHVQVVRSNHEAF